MIRLAALCLLSSVLCTCAAPAEVWLSRERAEQLRRISSRPYVTAADRQGTNTVYRWTNGSRTWSTTQAVQRVTGKPARNAWQDKLDREAAGKRAILDELKAVKDKPTAKSLKSILDKHDKATP